MSSSNSPCAACKFLRRKCTVGCIFAPYFPPDQPTKFANVHKVFGASNVGKLLVDLPAGSREQAVISLAYEAQARLHDPVLGCVGHVYALEQRLAQVRAEIDVARKELAMYIGPAAYGSFLQQAPHHHGLVGGAFHQPQYQYYRNPQGASSSMPQPYGAPGLGLGMGLGLAAPASVPQEQMLMRDPQQQQQQAQMLMREQQQAQMLMREQQQQHQAQMLMRGQQQQQQQQQQPQGQMLMLEQHQHAQMLMRDQQQLHHRQQRIAEDEQLALAIANVTREQEMLRNFTHQQQHQQHHQLQEQELFNLGFPDNVRGYDQMAFGGATIAVVAEPPSGLALVPPQQFEGSFLQEQQQHALQFNEQQQQQQHQYNEEQLLQQLQLQEEQQHTQPHHHRIGSDEGRSAMAPSS